MYKVLNKSIAAIIRVLAHWACEWPFEFDYADLRNFGEEVKLGSKDVKNGGHSTYLYKPRASCSDLRS